MSAHGFAPSLYITWLSGLLTNEKSCEWATWFKFHTPGFPKHPSSFDAPTWMRNHSELVKNTRTRLASDGTLTITTENQNKFYMNGKTASLVGTPDLVCVGQQPFICEVKTGTEKASDETQLLLYMWAMPKAVKKYKGMKFDGLLVYTDREVRVSHSKLDDTFVSRAVALIGRVVSDEPAIKVPSADECGWCKVAKAGCPDRLDEPLECEEQATDEF